MFTLLSKGLRYDQAFKDQMLSVYQNRMSLRGIKRTFGVCYQTVMALLGESRAVPAFVDTLLPYEKSDVLKLDELWSFVTAKAQQLRLWVALCQRTRQIVAYTLGDRNAQSACNLRASLPKGYQHCYTLSDLWEAYAAFPACAHRVCGKEAGETNHVERWFGVLRARTRGV